MEMATKSLILIPVFLGLLMSSCLADLAQEKEALLALKQGLNDEVGNLATWRSSDPSPCKWVGVICTNGAVTSLDLHSKNLSGHILDDIGFFSSLKFLNLSDNNLSGPLPAAIANLTKLQVLDIGANLFSFLFPAGFSKLQELQYFSSYDNNFTGPLPEELGELPYLEVLDLAGSYFNGSIPLQYAKLTRLKLLRLSANSLSGAIPKELGSLSQLTTLEIGYNTYSGGIPPELGDLGKLEVLDLAYSSLSGQIPPKLGNLKLCKSLFLFNNSLSGTIPPSLGNMTNLMSLDLSANDLVGSIPQELQGLQNLTLLSLMFNRLSGEIPPFLGTLPILQTLKIFSNFFTGSLPPALGRASSLTWVDVSSNLFTGPIPQSICQGGGLVKLELFSNNISGVIPDLTNCRNLVRLRLQRNQLTGAIPAGLGSLQKLQWIELSRNRLNGSIPADIGLAPSLSFVDVSNNQLDGVIPKSVWNSSSLQAFHASANMLSGNITLTCSKRTSLAILDLSNNSLSGLIVGTVEKCQKLVYLNLRHNKITGVIPTALARLPALAVLDLSWNRFIGTIPVEFQNLATLEVFDVAYNELSGEVPSQGIFGAVNSSYFSGNPGLCGPKLPFPCSGIGNTLSGQSRKRSPSSLVWIIGSIFAVAIALLIVAAHFFCKRSCLRRGLGYEDNVFGWKLTGFQRLGFTAYDVLSCLKESNIIGKGGAGTVYKGKMMNGEIVAVKKLRGSSKDHGFVAEVTVLGNIKHRNIVRLLGFCSNNDVSLLLYEYMPNGSLGELLHAGDAANVLGDWPTRYNIAVGVAQGLCYLHHDCFPPIVHRDVKSSNILLDSNMEARVADFGVAKLLEANNSMSVIAGSYGYIAPEYAYTLKVDQKGDIYSFGVVLLELLTGKKPVDPWFGDGMNIVEWVHGKLKIKAGIIEILDVSIAGSCNSVQEEMWLVMRIALLCTSKTPRDRPSMRDVVTMLTEAKPRRKGFSER